MLVDYHTKLVKEYNDIKNNVADFVRESYKEKLDEIETRIRSLEEYQNGYHYVKLEEVC